MAQSVVGYKGPQRAGCKGHQYVSEVANTKRIPYEVSDDPHAEWRLPSVSGHKRTTEYEGIKDHRCPYETHTL